MKNLRYFITMTLAGVLMASCMADSYDEPKTLDSAPFGDNQIAETHVVTIQQLKSDSKYSGVISGSGMTEITEDIQIKGIVTGNDIEGNIYNEVAVQDETGAILVCIAQGGLYGSLAVGQQVLIDLKGLYIGGYGQQAEIGMPYTSAAGSTYVSRMSRFVWEKHHKLIGQPDPSLVETMIETFDASKVSDQNYLAANSGKIMRLCNVTLQEADGTTVYAPNDGSVALTSNCANRAFKGISSNNLVLRTSTYADFANVTMPTEAVDVVGIFTRYRNTWQILLRSVNDIGAAKPEQTAIFSEPFAEGQGDFKIVNITMPSDLNFVWAFDSRYGMKASAYVNNTNYETESWLVSPAIDLSGVAQATLKFDHARRFGDVAALHVLYSTSYEDGADIDAAQWTELKLDDDLWPDGSSWDYVPVSLALPAAGKKNVHIAFCYTSTANGAATWEVKNFSVE